DAAVVLRRRAGRQVAGAGGEPCGPLPALPSAGGGDPMTSTPGTDLPDHPSLFSQRGVLNLAHSLQDVRDSVRRVNANRLNGIDAEWVDVQLRCGRGSSAPRRPGPPAPRSRSPATSTSPSAR